MRLQQHVGYGPACYEKTNSLLNEFNYRFEKERIQSSAQYDFVVIPISLILRASCLLKLSLPALFVLQVAGYLTAPNALLLKFFLRNFDHLLPVIGIS